MKVICGICKDAFSRHSKVSAVECGHMFHERCISKWCKASLTCPHCRFKLKEAPFRIKFEVKNSEKEFTELEYDQLEKHLEVLRGEERELKFKYDEVEKRLAKLRNEAYEAEKKAKKVKYDVTVWKQEFNFVKKAYGMTRHLEKENESMETKISLLTSLDKLLNGTVSDMYKILMGVPITSSTIEKLSKFIQVMRQKLKSNQDTYKKQRTELMQCILAMEKEFTDLEGKKKNVEVLEKSAQTDELPIRKQKKRKPKQITSK